MIKVLLVALGGAMGALLRYAMSGFTSRYLDGVFPCGTLMVNLVGCFVIGFLWQLFEMVVVSPNVRTFILIGILGAFTTFSTYGLESFNLIREGEFGFAVLNVLMSNVVGIMLVFCGFVVSRYFIGIFR
jgi:CrcB protein